MLPQIHRHIKYQRAARWLVFIATVLVLAAIAWKVI